VTRALRSISASSPRIARTRREPDSSEEAITASAAKAANPKSNETAMASMEPIPFEV
jgi:hypothetical protein